MGWGRSWPKKIFRLPNRLAANKFSAAISVAAMIAEFDLNPTLPGVADPYPTYRAICESDPVHWCTGAELWAITRYAEADAVLRDPRFSRQAFLDRVETRMGHQSIIEMQRHELVFMDNPRHHSLRSLLGEAITPAVIQTLRPGIEQRLKLQQNFCASMCGEARRSSISDTP